MYSIYYCTERTTDSSVGRAGDCSLVVNSDFSRSLVQIRLGGMWHLS